MLQSVKKNVFYLLGAEAAIKALMFLLIVVITRYLGVVKFGQFSFALSFALLFGIIVDFGLNQFTVREVAKDKAKAKRFMGNIISIKMLLCITTFVLIFATVKVLNYSTDISLLIYLAACFVLVNSFCEFFRSICQSFERMDYDALTRFLERAALLLIVFSVIFFDLGLKRLMLGYVFASLVALAFVVAFIWRRLSVFPLAFDMNFWAETIRGSIPFLLTSVFVTIYFRIDTIMLSAMKGDEAVGQYNAAYNLIFAFFFIPVILSKILLPRLAMFFVDSKENLVRIVNHSFRIAFWVGIICAIGMSIFSSEVLHFLYGIEFVSGAQALQLLSWVFFMICIGTVASVTLNAVNKQYIVTVGTAVGAVVNVILNYVFIPLYSLNGAALATLLTEITCFCILFIALRKQLACFDLQSGAA